MKIKTIASSMLICVFLLAGCTTGEAVEEASSLESEAYPASEEENENLVEDSRSINEDAYPSNGTSPGDGQGSEFQVDLPVSDGDQVITGTGPAGVPIILVKIPETDVILGETIVEEDGTFTFTLEEPFQSGHTAGLKLGNLDGTEFKESDFRYSDAYYEVYFMVNIE